jgi:hypothetical protein
MNRTSEDVQLAVEALAMTQCPAYHANGVCQTRCWEEPMCEVDEPTEGWIQYAIDLLIGIQGDESEKGPND